MADGPHSVAMSTRPTLRATSLGSHKGKTVSFCMMDFGREEFFPWWNRERCFDWAAEMVGVCGRFCCQFGGPRPFIGGRGRTTPASYDGPRSSFDYSSGFAEGGGLLRPHLRSAGVSRTNGSAAFLRSPGLCVHCARPAVERDAHISITSRPRSWILWRPISGARKRKRRSLRRAWPHLQVSCRCCPIPIT